MIASPVLGYVKCAGDGLRPVQLDPTPSAKQDVHYSAQCTQRSWQTRDVHTCERVSQSVHFVFEVIEKGAHVV